MQTYAWTCTLIMVVFASSVALGTLTDGCAYKCANGATPTQNPAEPPSSNGCGSYNITVDMKTCPYLNECCNQHDICYDQCGTSRAACDLALYNCTQHPPADCILKVYCKLFGLGMYNGVNVLACDAFLNAQKRVCSC
jgi:secretory phospholipase A2